MRSSLKVPAGHSNDSLECKAIESISHMVEMDSAGCVLWLINEGVLSGPSCYEYDEEDKQYHNEYGDDQASVDND